MFKHETYLMKRNGRNRTLAAKIDCEKEENRMAGL